MYKWYEANVSEIAQRITVRQIRCGFLRRMAGFGKLPKVFALAMNVYFSP